MLMMKLSYFNRLSILPHADLGHNWRSLFGFPIHRKCSSRGKSPSLRLRKHA